MKRRNKSDLPDPWEKQAGESAKAFEAFAKYRDMMAGERSVRKVARSLNKSSTLIAGWSSRYGWVKRVDAWDKEQDRIARVENEKAIKKMAKEHADIGNALLVKAAKGLTVLDFRVLTATDIARLVEVGSKLERISLGVKDNSTLEISGIDGAPIETDSKVTIYLPSNGREDASGDDG